LIASPNGVKRHKNTQSKGGFDQLILSMYFCAVSRGILACFARQRFPMLLKASSVTNLTDARYYAAKEVDYLGFNLEEGTEGFLDPVYMKAIREWVTGPFITGEFSRSPVAHVAAAAEFFGLDVVQLSAEHHLDHLADLRSLDILLHVQASADMASLEQVFHAASPFVSCFILDCSNLDHCEPLLYDNKAFWNALLALRPTLLQANLSAQSVSSLFEQLDFAGLSLVGGEEERVGVKSFDQIEEILEAIGR
jgi:phosphoribosylanthranilate isomerase